MIWGEPNRGGNFEPMPANSQVGPRRYALVLNAGYHALKSVSKTNLVIGGDTWSFGAVEPADFVQLDAASQTESHPRWTTTATIRSRSASPISGSRPTTPAGGTSTTSTRCIPK